MGITICVERGVYVLVGAPATLEQRCRIQCLAHPTGFITGPTGGMLGDIRRMPRSTRIHVAVRHGLHLPSVSGVRYRQTRALDARDWWVRPDGIKVARWDRLAFDLAADLELRDHTSVVHQMLDRKVVDLAELHAIGTLNTSMRCAGTSSTPPDGSRRP